MADDTPEMSDEELAMLANRDFADIIPTILKLVARGYSVRLDMITHVSRRGGESKVDDLCGGLVFEKRMTIR